MIYSSMTSLSLKKMLTEKLDFSNLRRLGEHFLLFQASAPHPAPCYKKLDVFPINLSQKVFLCSDDLLCRRPFRTIVPQDLHQLRTNLPQNLHHSQSVTYKFTPDLHYSQSDTHQFTLRFALSQSITHQFTPRYTLIEVRYALVLPQDLLVLVAHDCNPAIGGQGQSDTHGFLAINPCPSRGLASTLSPRMLTHLHSWVW